jgi:hypothetical protein
MVFSKKKNLNYSFILQDKQLEVVEKNSYLGINFKYNGTFFDTKKKLVDQAQRNYSDPDFFKHNINLYKELLNFVSLFTSLYQYEIIRSFTRISKGNLPNRSVCQFMV